MRGFSGEVKKGMAPVGGVGQKAGKTAGRSFVGGLGGSLKGVAGVFGAVFAAQKIVGFMGDTIKAASDLGESVNAVNVVFGKAAKGILKLGENAAESVGLSQTEFQGMAVQFSAFAETIAGKGGDVVGTIDQISVRAADFASVMNLDVAEAAQLFQSGLAGETEPLRRFGIDLSAASVQAFAYANGIAESGEELTESQKVQARYQSLLEQTSKTQGDFANTSDSLANRQRILSSQWEDMKARLGQSLIPAAEGALGILGKLMPVVEGLFSGGGRLGGVLDTVKSAFMSVWAAVKPLVPSVTELGRQFIAAIIPAFQRISSMITGTLVPALAGFLVAARPVLKFLIETVGGALIGAFKGAVKFIEGALETISGVLDVFTGLFTGDWEKMWGGVKKIASGVWKLIQGAFQVFINVGILRLARIGLKLLTGIFRGGWNAIKGLAAIAFAGIVNLVRNSWSRIKTATRNGISGVLSFVRGLPRRILSALGNVGRLLFNAGKSILQGLIDGLWSMVSKVTAPVSAAVDKVKSYWPFSPAETGPLRRDPPETWGMNVMAGVAAGLRKGSTALGPASSLAASAALPMAGVPSTAAAAAGNTLIIRGSGALFELIQQGVRTRQLQLTTQNGGRVIVGTA